jgi:hypothetical protein
MRSSLPTHTAELRDAIFQTVPKIVDMLRGNRDEAEAAASALVELAAHGGLNKTGWGHG